MTAKRFDIHSEYCPTDCVIDTDISDVLECCGHAVTHDQLTKLEVGEKIDMIGCLIERRPDSTLKAPNKAAGKAENASVCLCEPYMPMCDFCRTIVAKQGEKK